MSTEDRISQLHETLTFENVKELRQVIREFEDQFEFYIKLGFHERFMSLDDYLEETDNMSQVLFQLMTFYNAHKQDVLHCLIPMYIQWYLMTGELYIGRRVEDVGFEDAPGNDENQISVVLFARLAQQYDFVKQINLLAYVTKLK